MEEKTQKRGRNSQNKNSEPAPVKSAPAPAVAESNKPIIPKSIDDNQYVTVKNGCHGVLIYKSKRTGETFKWDEYCSEQEMQLRELKDAKNSSRKFFESNWFIFDDDNQWVVDYLGMRRYYANAIGCGKFDDLFKLPLDEMTGQIKAMSKGQKDSVAHRAYQLIVDGEIDSRKCISTLEELLGVQLIER